MYSISLNLRINWISCPGVWLCAKGYVVIKLTALGGSQWSQKINPKFPIFINELFAFERVIFGGIDSLRATLEREQVHVELIQWISSQAQIGVILATFSQRLSHFFNHLVVGESGFTASTRMPQMLMNKTEYFPGIISPKIACSLQLQIKNRAGDIGYEPSISQDRVHHILRKRSVCHSKGFALHRHQWEDENPYLPWTSPRERFDCSKENGVIFDNKNEIKHPFCWWCYDTNASLSCACCSCRQYHLTFH